MRGRLVTVWALSLFDALATTYAIGCGYAVEANPLMAFLMSYGFAAFILGKMLVTTASMAVVDYVYRRHPRRYMLTAMSVVVGVYGLLTVWHIALYLLQR